LKIQGLFQAGHGGAKPWTCDPRRSACDDRSAVTENEGTMPEERILITGACGDLGQALVSVSLREGRRVHAVDRSAPDLEGLLSRFGDRVIAHPLDVTNEADVVALFDTFTRSGTVPDHCVLAAGIIGDLARFDQSSLANFQHVMNVNVVGTYLFVRGSLRAMRGRGTGSVVTIASIAGQSGSPGLAAYSASKHAVIGVTRSAARDCLGTSIRVNAVAPGFIQGRMMKGVDSARRQGANDMSELQAVRTIAGRYAKPEEIAEAVHMLTTPAASYMNGTCLTVDGGLLA
jgi:NAD(P)-dependent dehydrogenase (short-subunit alcohol dehydrogenase family)